MSQTKNVPAEISDEALDQVYGGFATTGKAIAPRQTQTRAAPAGSGQSEDVPVEDFSLNFETIVWTY